MDLNTIFGKKPESMDMIITMIKQMDQQGQISVMGAIIEQFKQQIKNMYTKLGYECDVIIEIQNMNKIPEKNE